jgi:hypothetical protein
MVATLSAIGLSVSGAARRGAARLILNVDRPRLLVERDELPRERRVVIDEGTHLCLLGTLLLRSLCTRRIRSGGVHQTAFLL